MKVTAKELANLLQATLEGNPQTVVTKVARIEESDPESFCFLANPKYFHYAMTRPIGILLCNETMEYEPANIGAVLRVKDPYAAFQQLMEWYTSLQGAAKVTGVSDKAVVEADASLGEGTSVGALAYIGRGAKIGNRVQIYPQCYIGDGVVIGDDTILYAGVKIYAGCVIGNRCIIHAGAVVGSDGFGFAQQQDGSYKKIPQTGNVVIEDDVEIGANTCIDRAVMGSTRIGKGVKLDNLIQIAHNVCLGEHTAIAAQAGISGSTHIGKYVMIGGQAGITGHLKIGDRVKIQAQAAVIHDIEDGKGISGTPAIDARQHYRQLAAIRQLPDLLKKIYELEKKLNDKT
ncbi:MAG: UDP-3-O-(3-hydroxymyristoyl)glucosamine N-acyltransferase [Chitinophagales bacterium]|nr:UDP-3-O-(3-hydroxymyristoyl)glucosamine N-acyltransferase [Chitinophagales bacterium]MDW8418786.1 UDP-3-O-(3-hydroxymyristoyl)glucosamine N-acyltransferase [Chitinophagales bacterium]